MGMLATSDVEIVKQTNPGWNWDDGTVFGATEDYSPN
jgi:hypothetical protein